MVSLNLLCSRLFESLMQLLALLGVAWHLGIYSRAGLPGWMNIK